MNIHIDILIFSYGSFAQITDFLDKCNKSNKCINIKDIEFITSNEKITKDIVDKLYQYSHLIGGKIRIKIKNKLKKRSENIQKNFSDIFLSKNRSSVNFIDFINMHNIYHDCSNNFLYPDVEQVSSSDIFYEKFRNKPLLFDFNNNYFYRCIRTIKIRKESALSEYLEHFLGFCKEYQYAMININCDYSSHARSNILKLNSNILETILDTKYREEVFYSFLFKISGGQSQFKKNRNRYFKFHKIKLQYNDILKVSQENNEDRSQRMNCLIF